MEANWISVKKQLPETTGSYLCISNDNKYMVCFIAVNGCWTVVPSGKFYGDMGGNVVIDSKEVEREVQYWMPLPSPPVENLEVKYETVTGE